MSDGHNERFLAGPLAYTKNHSMHPGDAVGTYLGDYVKPVNGVTQQTSGSELKPISMHLAKVKTGKKVAWIDFTTNSVANEGANVIQVRGQFPKLDTGFPAWFLPWDTEGAIVRLTIPFKGTGWEDEDPDIFFTAAINGCSVFFQGTAKNPTIYHAGGNTYQKSPEQGAAFWRGMITLHNKADEGELSPHEVNKTDYVKRSGFKGGESTPNAVAYENWLKKKNKSTLKVTTVRPWGCVFGLRTGEDWKFYLQENATVIYNTFTKKSFFSRKKAQEHIVSKVMTVREIFPSKMTTPISFSPMTHITET